MVIKKEILSDLYSWIDYVSVPRDEINQWSICPFAKSSKNIDIKICKISYDSIDQQVEDLSSRDLTLLTEGSLYPSFLEIDLICRELNKKHKDLIFLPDHPDNKNYIRSIETGNRKYSLIVAQKKEKLLRYRNILLRKDYYDYWNKEYQNEIFSYGKES